MPVETIMEKRLEADESTLADAGFFWRESGGVRVLVCRALEDAGFTNGFSTRVGGVSPFPENDLNLSGYDIDTPENIAENRRRFLAALGGAWQIATVWQVHGDRIRKVSEASEAVNLDERADAVMSDLNDVLAGVKTADCVPVLMGDPVTGAFAAVHAGWRGTVQTIVKKAISRMAEEYGSKPADVICAVGPAACGRNYEVGQDVIDAFADSQPGHTKYFSTTRPGHALVDLHWANRDQLQAAGVNEENIFTAPLCTMERPDLFFSYRIDKPRLGRTGRLLSVIGRRG
jgi:YfiH family protein